MRLGKAAGLRFVYVGNVPGHAWPEHRLPGVRSHGDPRERAEDRPVGESREGLCAACGEDLGVVGA